MSILLLVPLVILVLLAILLAKIPYRNSRGNQSSTPIWIESNSNSENDEIISKSKYQYKAKPYLMTSRESEFFKILNDIFGSKWYIIPQVHLSALLNPDEKGYKDRFGAFRHINGKSVDYVLMSKESYKIICAIELDDSTHTRTNRKERDEEVERIFKTAKIPLARIKNFKKLSKQEIINIISETIRN